MRLAFIDLKFVVGPGTHSRSQVKSLGRAISVAFKFYNL